VTDDTDRLRSLLAAAGLSQTSAARTLGISEREFRAMCAGSRPVPPVVFLALEHLAEHPPKT
jgi:plasmid maintenance system antidote protein VapI